MVNNKKTNRNAPPPCSAVIYGKRHTAPRPIADPAAASIKPILEFQLFSDKFIPLFNH